MQILDLLEIRHGMVALTKAALVDEDTRARAAGRGTRRLAGRGRRLVVRPRCRRGRDDARLVLAAAFPHDVGRPRLWVDRSRRRDPHGGDGQRTGGALARDDEVLIEPGGRHACAPKAESHHEQLDAVARREPVR